MLEREPTQVNMTALDGRNRGRLNGVKLACPRVHVPHQILWRSGIPLIGPVDTLLELAAILAAEELEMACARALHSRMVSRTQLTERFERSPPRPGLRALRTAAQAPVLTRSKYERMLRRLVAQAELPHHESNVVVLGKELDLYWPEAKLGIEVDVFGTHGDTASFEDDRKVDVDLAAADLDVRRITGRRIERAPYAVIARISALLTLKLGGLPPPRRR